MDIYWLGDKGCAYHLQTKFSFLDRDNFTEVTGISGNPLWLRPSNIQTKNVSFLWKKIQPDSSGKNEVLIWNSHKYQTHLEFSNDFNNTYDFRALDFALSIKSAKLQDSALYELEITKSSGVLCTKKFQVLILDHVEKPHLQGQLKIVADGMCQVSLYCLVSKDDNVSYALYRGSKLIAEHRNFTDLENKTNSSSLHTYTCTVSNKVSSANSTLNFTQGCQSVPQSKKTASERFNLSGDNLHGSGQKGKEQMPGQKPPGAGSTIYSMIQYKPPDSASQEKYTLYSAIQPSRKSGSKKRKQNPYSNCTVYEEVGKQCSMAYEPARLSRRELANFDVYS
ncbi:hypothetical protein STEG23_010195 [Scotinomys teguina]